MSAAKRLFDCLAAYARADDPLTAATNFIALVVVANQPLYPLYLRLFVGADAGVSLLTFISTPFFLAVPILARRASLLGRAMLPVVGLVNTFFCAKVFGQASGVELFLCPCAMIAGMSLRAEERKVLLLILGLAFGGFLALHNRYGAPLHLFTDEEYSRFLSMNAVSVGALIGLVAMQYSSALAAPNSSGTSGDSSQARGR
jgi:hypothetical protein